MRTTLRIQDDLFRRIKTLAAKTNRTMTEIIEDSLRMTLEGKTAKRNNPASPPPSSGSGGVLPGVNLDDTSSLYDIMDGLSGPPRH